MTALSDLGNIMPCIIILFVLYARNSLLDALDHINHVFGITLLLYTDSRKKARTVKIT